MFNVYNVGIYWPTHTKKIKKEKFHYEQKKFHDIFLNISIMKSEKNQHFELDFNIYYNISSYVNSIIFLK
jgi:hypothetical protein